MGSKGSCNATKVRTEMEKKGQLLGIEIENAEADGLLTFVTTSKS